VYMAFETLDLPPLYCDFDNSSASAQRAYLRILQADLAVLVLAAAVSAHSTGSVTSQRVLYAIGAVLLAAGLLISVALSRNAYEKTWYLGRASAETVKSLAWKYMMRAAPFEGEITSVAIDQAFLKSLAAILRERSELAFTRKTESSAGEPITPKMRVVRTGDLANRLNFYLEYRVKDQVQWYSSKSRHNDNRQSQWFWALIGIQFVALTRTIVQVVVPPLSTNYAGALAALATAVLAWLQIKRYRELAQSYAVAAHELGLAAGLAMHIEDEKAMSQFVNDTESAISREHTMWIARREAGS